MIEVLDIESATFNSNYQAPAVMAERGSASAFSGKIPLKHFFPEPLADEQNETVTLTDLRAPIFDPSFSLAHEFGKKAKESRAGLWAYRARIESLRADAEEDGYSVNLASERDFWQFIRSEPFIRKGNLVLLDNGNLRAVWKDANGTHIALQFLGGNTVQYVIFKRRTATEGISRVAGRDSLEGVKRQISAFDLRSLIYA